MKKNSARFLAVMTAAATLTLGAAGAVQAEDHPPIAVPAQTVTEAPTVDHGYLVGAMTVGENGETIVNEDGSLHLYKKDGAFILNDRGEALSFDDIKAGDKITYYVDGEEPMTLQLPVHHSPSVIVVSSGDAVSQKIAVFDEDGLSDEGDLIINYDLDTPYFSHTREAAFISGKALVLYNFTTRSIPAQTSPIAIVKLIDDEPEIELPFMGHGPQMPLTEASQPAYITGGLTVSENGETLSCDSGGEEICFYKNENTLIIDKKGEQKTFDDIKAGDSIIYFVNADEPMTLQLPVHYNAEVIVIDDGSDVSVLQGVFDGELLDAAASLQLNISGDTKIYGADSFTGGRALVLYNFATMSIPAQTTPIAVVVLANQPKLTAEPSTPAQLVPDLSGVKRIIAGDKVLDYIPVTVNGIQMLPVRAVAEALGNEVTWNGEGQTVTVGFASFSIENDSYAFAKMAPQALGQAPVLIALPGHTNATTYVPAAFFTAVMDYGMTVDGDALIINSADEISNGISTMPIFEKIINVPQE